MSGGTDCDSTPDTNSENDGEIIDDSIGERCDESDTDEDDHDPEVIVVKVSSDLELIKSIKNPQATYAVGDSITYNIVVTNQGTTDLTNLKIEDHYGTELVLNDSDWDNNATDNIATLKGGIAVLAAGATFSTEITFTIAAGATGSVKNAAGVCSESEPDCDPQPPVSCEDTDEANNPDGCAEIMLDGPSIKIDKTAKDGTDSQTVAVGATAVFKIIVTNDGDVDLTNVVIADPKGAACIRTSAQTTILIQAIGNSDAIFQPGEVFSYECSVPNTPSDYINTALVTADPVDTSLGPVNDNDPSNVVIPGNPGNPGNPGSGGLVYACESMKV